MQTTEWIDCPVCEDGKDSQAEADQCKQNHLANGIVELPDGSFAAEEDVWDPSEEDHIEEI